MNSSLKGNTIEAVSRAVERIEVRPCSDGPAAGWVVVIVLHFGEDIRLGRYATTKAARDVAHMEAEEHRAVLVDRSYSYEVAA